jgi:uncharacterized repeat protein (TIGR03847 family)
MRAAGTPPEAGGPHVAGRTGRDRARVGVTSHLPGDPLVPRRIYDFGVPDRFVTGTVGQPGHRTFFLQARKGSAVVSVVIEKIQVHVLAERLALLLAEIRRRGVQVPEALAPSDDDTAPLGEPLVEAYRVGTLTLGWDPQREQVVIEAREQQESDEDEAEEADEEDDADEEAEDAEDEADAEPATLEFDDSDPEGPDLVRVRLTPLAARAFVERALRTVAAGRPPCPFCGLPLDPTGHICPRKNGYVH